VKILHVNTTDSGGAAKACLRLHLGLIKAGIDSKVLVFHQTNSDVPQVYEYRPYKQIIIKRTIGSRLIRKTKRLLKEFYLYHEAPSKRVDPQKQFLENRSKELEMYSFPNSEIDITNNKQFIEADIIHLHWVARFLDYKSFFAKCNKPVIWTLHDMFPFTGGEHYTETLNGIDGFGYPAKRDISELEQEANKLNIEIKRDALSHYKNLIIVTPSNWLNKEATSSGIFSDYPILTIPYGLDTSIFKPQEKNSSRRVLNLPKDKLIVLFVADQVTNKRKGFEYLLKAIPAFDNNNLHFCIVGSTDSSGILPNHVTFLGRIYDERLMSIVYSAADLFVIPSVMDNLPNTVLESLACGTPVIGFPVGGIPDMIVEGVNGYLCQEISVRSLIYTINKFVKNHQFFDRGMISQKAHEKYKFSNQAESYINLYKTFL
jgi:glycosyltransferase involved in cell wall biosynthesis